MTKSEHLLPLCYLLTISILLPIAVHADTSPTSQPTTQPTRKNLVFNGDFEIIDPKTKLPKGWSTKHPDNIRIVKDATRGNVIEMKGGKKLMASYGVDLLSIDIPLKANTRYRCTGWTRSTKPNMKVFVKGYATVKRRVSGEIKTLSDQCYQMRKDIDATTGWTQYAMTFEIRPTDVFSDHKHGLDSLRILLWGYWPVGTCWFDDIRLEELPDEAKNTAGGDKPTTHQGTKPRLGPEAAEKDTIDEPQLWLNAVNAFRGEKYAQTWGIIEQLLAKNDQHPDYRLLAARCAAELGQIDAASRHADWLLSDKRPAKTIKPYYQEWANVVRAHVLLIEGKRSEAAERLRAIADSCTSPHVKKAAETLLSDIRKQKENR